MKIKLSRVKVRYISGPTRGVQLFYIKDAPIGRRATYKNIRSEVVKKEKENGNFQMYKLNLNECAVV